MSETYGDVTALVLALQSGSGIALPADEAAARELVAEAARVIVRMLLDGTAANPKTVLERLSQVVSAVRVRPPEAPNYVWA